MEGKTGRTFWDWVSEHPKLFVLFAVVGLAVSVYIVNHFKVVLPSGLSIERQPDPNVTQQKKEVKSSQEVTSQEMPQKFEPHQTKPRKKNELEEKSIDLTNQIDNYGLSITIIDNVTKRPVEGVSISFTGFPDILTTNKNGVFIIPKTIIEARGEYNTVRAYFSRSGFESIYYEIGLSESLTFKINKLQ